MGAEERTDPRRGLPAVDRVLSLPAVQALEGLYGRELVRVHVRRELDSFRDELSAGPGGGAVEAPGPEALGERVRVRLEAALGQRGRRVINATGIFLHTNLGRAPLPREVSLGLPELLDAGCDLELDLESGRRSDRNRRAEPLLTALTGAEAAVVTNNNAAALALGLATLAAGAEVVVSRGELVEIGGSFRIPDIIEAAGARLVEVGTTNRTRAGDYRRAVGPATAALLKVHQSNYRMVGFVESVSTAELVEIGDDLGLPVLVDEGAGLLRSRPEPQLLGHPSMRELVAAGAGLVCGSGDKLLGGPQAGLLVGRQELVRRCRRHPLYRVVRPDRTAYAALEAVLRLHLAGAPLPIDRLWVDPDAHRRRLEWVAARVPGSELSSAEAFVGGGAAPEEPIPGEVLAVAGDDDLAPRLRLGEPAVVGYVREGRLLLDLRTVAPEDDEALVAALTAALVGSGDGG